jgi:hypothetical protein
MILFKKNLGLNVVKIGSERHVKKSWPVRRGPEWLDHVAHPTEIVVFFFVFLHQSLGEPDGLKQKCFTGLKILDSFTDFSPHFLNWALMWLEEKFTIENLKKILRHFLTIFTNLTSFCYPSSGRFWKGMRKIISRLSRIISTLNNTNSEFSHACLYAWMLKRHVQIFS